MKNLNKAVLTLGVFAILFSGVAFAEGGGRVGNGKKADTETTTTTTKTTTTTDTAATPAPTVAPKPESK